ncbi:VPS39-like protein [Mya arenaria]|uniref:VPS39-like protein n=1 Tax=Mya arenaria TaxID=6604 RepID=A0ABY7FEP0_MYAAR|nr:VPS39-like protein [Mya arenaria]
MDAYYVEKIISFKTLGIAASCIAAHGDILLAVVDTELREYKAETSFDASSDGLHVHDFGDNYEHILDIPDTEGLTFFDVFEWNGKEYVEKHVDLKLSRPAKAAMWCGDNIVIGFKDEYIIVKMQSSEAAGHNQSLINSIRAHQGVYFFCKNKFVESMEIFSRLDTDIHHKRAAIVSGGEDVFFTPIWPHKDNVTLKTKEEALIIREERVAPLLRQPDNKVHVQAAERALAKSHKYTELIILYEEHGRHADALQVMKNQSKNTKSSLQGFESTIHKLQQLGTAHLNLIYEWSKWVFEVNPYEALQIFTEDVQTVRELPRGHILSFLETLDTLPMIVIQYLEHVIYEWGDQTEELHQALASHLKNAVLKEYQDSRSFHYMPPCRLKKHEQALGIYVYVYLDLLKVYLYPPKPLSLGIQEFRREPKQKLADALAMLETHAAEINLYKAVSILPEDLTIKKLRSFLEVALEASVCPQSR